jgi:predicted RNase H-like nuclease
VRIGSGRWALRAIASSYQDFTGVPCDHSVPGQPRYLPDISSLLKHGEQIAQSAIDLIAVDIPLARSPITGRRTSDDAVSIAYGGRGCGTHTQNAARQGRFSEFLRKDFGRAGYALQTTSIRTSGLIEVYPHPALVELAGTSKRLPYKLSRVGRYWPSLQPLERRERLVRVWSAIVRLLNTEIDGVIGTLPPVCAADGVEQLKCYEDMLDAVVCAWVGICALEGRAIAFGDYESAIWVPSYRVTARPD